MKKIFLRDDRLRKILADRNKKIELMLLTKKLKGSLSVRLATNGIHFGWEITDLENGQTIKELLGETAKEKIEPTGTITPTKDFFKFKSKNLGVFEKPKIKRNNNTK